MKKFLSVLLVLTMLLSAFPFAVFAADDYDHLPQIYVEGLDSKPIYYKDDPEKNPLFYPIDGEMILSNLMKYEEYIKQGLTENDHNLVYTYLYQWMYDCYGMTALKEDGYTMLDEVTVPETQLNYKGDGKYVFQYDTRLGPVDVAKELNDYVAWIQAETGSERFELAASSYGASVAIAYLHEYPEMQQYIDSLVLCVPASNGINFIGEIFSGEIAADPDALVGFMDKMIGNDDLTLILSLFNKTGTLDSILGEFLTPAIEVIIYDILKDVLRDIFATWPSLWTFVDDEHFYSALEYIYGEDYADKNNKYAVHIEKLIYYHEEIMVNNYEILENANNGIHINILTKYGEPSFPMTKEGNMMGDTLVTLDRASFGATSSMHEEKLPEDYKQALHTEYNLLSPDGCVDASTCLFPFNTWFIKGLSHSTKNSAYYELINTVLYEDLDVFTDPARPQYLEVPEYDGQALVPMSKGEEKKETSWLQDFLTLLPRLLKMLAQKLSAFLNK